MQLKKCLKLAFGAISLGLVLFPTMVLADGGHGKGHHKKHHSGGPPVHYQNQYHSPRGYRRGHGRQVYRPVPQARVTYYHHYPAPVYYPPQYQGHRHRHGRGHEVYHRSAYRVGVGVQVDGFYFGFNSGY